jgi:hypothetical protein
MFSPWCHSIACTLLVTVLLGPSVNAQEHPSPNPTPTRVDLIVEAGRPLRVALDARVHVTRVGQPITGTLVDPLYAYDRIVVPAGTIVRGHVERLDHQPPLGRVQALAGGDFSPNLRVVVQFDTLTLSDGSTRPIRTRVAGAAEHISLTIAPATPTSSHDDDRKSVSDRAREKMTDVREQAAERARDTLKAIKSPGKLERLKAAFVMRLPYHPDYLPKGTVYTADLVGPLDFGPVEPSAAAASGTRPAPDSILTARLVTPLDSATTPREAPVEAVVTEPVFSEDHQLIVPEGSRLLGEVTFSRSARRFRRGGQLRLLVESVQPPAQEASRLLASLYSVQVADTNAVTVDEEGGTRARESKTRFIAPALAVMALRASTHREPRRMDNDADDSLGPRPAGSPASFGLGGFFGWGLAGAAVSQIARPAGVALAAIGVARTMYRSVFAKGREVRFPADTVIQVQLAPGPASPR